MGRFREGDVAPIIASVAEAAEVAEVAEVAEMRLICGACSHQYQFFCEHGNALSPFRNRCL